MIQSKMGEVKITRPNYDLCEILDCSKEDVDAVTEATLGDDLISILCTLGDIYGAGHAMEMWTRSAEIYRESLIGETK